MERSEALERSEAATAATFVAQLESLKEHLQPQRGGRSLPQHFGWIAAAALLSSLFLHYGFRALTQYRHAAARRRATALHHLKTEPQWPSLSPDLSVVVRAIDDRGRLKAILKNEDDPPSSRFQEVWTIVANTVARREKVITPVIIPHLHGAVSFITLPTPAVETELVGPLREALRQAQFLPRHTPRRGPLKDASLVSLQTSVVNGRLHPELVLSVLL